MIVALVISAEGTVEHIVVDIDRLLFSAGSGNMDGHNDIAVIFIGFNVVFSEKIDADLICIIDDIPEFLLQLGGIL